MKLFVLNLIYPLFVSNLQMVSFYVSYLVEQFQESEAGPCYNMYHPQHYLLHELPIINENYSCDIIRVSENSYFILYVIVMDTEELAGML